ncbi:hypothetical protein BH10PSE12_BH10PSE12_37200 [soil metagenome]
MKAQRGARSSHPSYPKRSATGLATEAEIIRVAIPMFAVRGYGFVSMREIAIGAGITAPTIYNYFADKKQLYKAVCAECLLRSSNRIAEAIADAKDARERVHCFVYALTETMISDSDSTMLFQRELIFADREMLSLMSEQPFKSVFNTVAKSLEELTGSQSSSLQTTAIYALTLGMIQYGQLFEAGGFKPFPFDNNPEQLAKFVLEILVKN